MIVTMKNLLKKAVCIFIVSVMLLQTVLLCACNKQTSGMCELSFVKVEDEYAVQIKQGATIWDNVETGVFGVRVAYDYTSDVSDVDYAFYNSYNQIDGGYEATAILTAQDGSQYQTIDTFKVSSSGVEVVRTFSVMQKGSALGFTTYFPLRDNKTGAVEEREWFAPGNYYGNDDYNFSGVGIKTGFCEEAIIAADNMSAPVIANYCDEKAFSIIDKTKGYRETVVADYDATISWVLVDDRINIPGIGIKNAYEGDETYVEMYHTYPSETYNYINTRPFTHNYRMLPIVEGLSREIAFEISINDYSNFQNAVDGIWRNAYEDYSVIDYRYSPLAVYEALAQNLYKSHGYLNSVPQYMVNTDHPLAESGFLYRNVDLAYLMICAGYRLNKPEYIEQANSLIDFHIEKDMIANSINDVERAEAEGILAVLNAYKVHLKNGVDKSDWLAFVIKATKEKAGLDHPMDIPLYLAVAEYTKDNSYVEKSTELLKEYEQTHADFYYEGAIVNPSMEAIPNRESGMIYLNIYLQMYEITGEKHYLEKAKQCESYVESNMIIQSIAWEAVDSTGYEVLSDGRFREISTGNSQVKPYGLSWISGQTASVDNMTAYSVPDLLKLYDITGEERYKVFADYLVVNSSLYVNMGDKNWIMDDFRHSAGLGFQNEYFGLAPSTDVVAGSRGSMHASNLGWNMFVVFYSLERYVEYDENFFNQDLNAYDTSVLKNVSASSELNSIYRSYNAVDKNSETSWKPAQNDTEKQITVDLGEFVNLQKVVMKSFNVNKATLYASTDGVSFTKLDDNFVTEKEVKGVYRYIRISLTDCESGAGISDLDVLGNPVVAKNYALDAKTTVSGVEIKEMTDWDYSTSWQSSKQSDTIVVDLGTIKTITEISMTFKNNLSFIGQDYVSLPVNQVNYSYVIEYSNTGDNWKTYVDRSSEPKMMAVYKESNVVKARYFRIIATSSRGNLSMTELKISGV